MRHVVKNSIIHPTTLCAYSGNFNAGICDGDSGGGAYYNNEFVGITSWAWTCGAGHPDGFQRISSFIDWIDEMIAVN